MELWCDQSIEPLSARSRLGIGNLNVQGLGPGVDMFENLPGAVG